MHFARLSPFPALYTLLLILTFNGTVTMRAQEPDEHLKISLNISPDTLRAGSSSEILLSFRPQKGYHVNAVPTVGFTLDSGAVAILGDSLIVSRDTATGYLDVHEEVRQVFTLSKSVGPGQHELKGMLTYYYCSDIEGWCRREKLPFSLPLYVR